jgi:hypothetical protein
VFCLQTVKDEPAKGELMAQYFDGSFEDVIDRSWFDSAKARGTALKVTDTIPPANSLPAQKDCFSFRVFGKIKIPSTGEYCFMTVSDDSSHVYLDDKHIVDNSNYYYAPPVVSEWILLKEGQVISFEAMWRNHIENLKFQLSWQLRIAGVAMTEQQNSMKAFLL